MLDRKAHIEELLEMMQSLRRTTMDVPKGAADLTLSQGLMISHILRNDSCTTSEAAAALRITGSAATQLINVLVKKGYVQRAANPHDRRAHQLRLSTRSKQKIAALRAKRLSLMLGLFDALTDEEFKQYVALNKKILTTLPKRRV